jgi:hypothetical protein
MGQLNQSTMAIYIPRKQDSGRFSAAGVPYKEESS